MPKFTVCVTADATVSQVMLITAPNKVEAEMIALQTYDYEKFELDDNMPQDVYISWSSEDRFEPVQCLTRADLYQRTPWFLLDLTADTAGNPCVWLNHYRDDAGREWSDPWSCQCDYEEIPPYSCDWIGPEDQAEIALWESLPDAS